MDFFAKQAKAESATFKLLTLFTVAVAAVAVSTTAVIFGAFCMATKNFPNAKGVLVKMTWMESLKAHYQGDIQEWWILAGLVAVAVVLTSAIKGHALAKGGGRAIAESLGGRLVAPGSADANERKLLNVVEEMALAAGTPVPPVYILGQDNTINAFAAGFKPGDAAIGVTQGAIERLTRDELQGVIAHEFSHIVHGDMRLNSQLIGVVFGLLGVAMVGRFLVHMASRSSSSSSKKGDGTVYLLSVGGALMLVGWVGHLAGEIIRAAVCRQREYLADASATQYTRNPQGLAQALSKAGEGQETGRVEPPAMHQIKHMFFVEAVRTHFDAIFATHPALEARIKALGAIVMHTKAPVANAAPAPASAAATPGVSGFAAVPPAAVKSSTNFLSSMPADLMAAARDPYAARAVIFCTLLDPSESVRSRQMQSIAGAGDAHLVEVVTTLTPLVAQRGSAARIPLVDLALPALKNMSDDQKKAFFAVTDALIAADGKVDLFEYTLVKMLKRRLNGAKFKAPVPNPKVFGPAAATVLSAVASAGGAQETPARFQKAAQRLASSVGIQLQGPVAWDFERLDAALATLGAASAAVRSRLVEACAHCAADDGALTIEGAELVRATADALELAVPSFLTWPISGKERKAA